MPPPALLLEEEELSMIYRSRPQPSVMVKGSIGYRRRPVELRTLCRELRPVNDSGHSCNVRCRSRNSRPDPETGLSSAVYLRLRVMVVHLAVPPPGHATDRRVSRRAFRRRFPVRRGTRSSLRMRCPCPWRSLLPERPSPMAPVRRRSSIRGGEWWAWRGGAGAAGGSRGGGGGGGRGGGPGPRPRPAPDGRVQARGEFRGGGRVRA